MTNVYYAILTQKGKEKQVAAMAAGGTLRLAEMEVGDGGGAVPVPDETRQTLIGSKHRAPLNELKPDAKNANWLIAEMIIPETIGGFWVRELGLRDADGDLIAIGNCAPSYKPILAEGSGKLQRIRMIIQVDSTNAFQLIIDPSVVLVSREYADEHYAPINSPEFKGSPLAPTPPQEDNSDRIATTRWFANRYGSIRLPANVSPADNAVSVALAPTLTAGNYYSLYNIAQAAARFQVASDPEFTRIVFDQTVGAVTTLAAAGLATTTIYFWRVQFQNIENQWSEWSRPTEFSTGAVTVTAPYITFPANGATAVSPVAVFYASALSVTGAADTHLSSDWRISTGPNRTGQTVYAVDVSTTEKTSMAIPTGTLVPNNTYYASVRYTAAIHGASSWSIDVMFAVSAGVITPLIIEPSDGASEIGETPTLKSSNFAVVGSLDPHASNEGWPEVLDPEVIDDDAGASTEDGPRIEVPDGIVTDAHASTDWEVWEGRPETGVKVLDVLASTQSKLSLQLPAGLLHPNRKYYPRVRHRGATLGASAWSPLSTFRTAAAFVPVTPGAPFGGGYYAGRYMQDGRMYALIISPKAFGESPNRGSFALEDSAFFSIQSSDIDGFKNCQTLGTLSPFASWARSLAIGGYTDWYLPAKYELEILFVAFKPVAGENWAHNIANPYSVPPGILYTTTVPGMTTDPRFKFGGSEAMDSDTMWYRSSTWESQTDVGLMVHNGMMTGTHVSSTGLSARAVRRVLITA